MKKRMVKKVIKKESPLFTTEENYVGKGRSSTNPVLTLLKLDDLPINAARKIPFTSPLFRSAASAGRRYNVENKNRKVSVIKEFDANKKVVAIALKRIA